MKQQHGTPGDIDAKPSFRAINEAHLFFGFLDWRYGLIAGVAAVLIGQVCFRSKIATVIAFFVCEAIAVAIYEYDPSLPMVLAKTCRDKSHTCPFLDREEY